VLGASSWRIEEITHDRVLVTPAPGHRARCRSGAATASDARMSSGWRSARSRASSSRAVAAAVNRLTRDHDLTEQAAENLVAYLRDERAAVGTVPDADTIVVQRVRDDLGDWRVCILSPRGGRVHAPWAIAAAARIRQQLGIEVETLWADDGFVVRFPDVDAAPDPDLLFPSHDEIDALMMQELGGTSLFAARFRENAARALLLPRRRAGQRAPLWQQRRRAADLLAVASRFGSFPIILETYRECLRDVFDVAALVDTLRRVKTRDIKVEVVDPKSPSPFAASVLFGYVANFMYDGDAPLAERRAQALSVDPAQLRELVGNAELRELLDASEMDAVEALVQRVDPQRHARSADGVHDLVLQVGDLTIDEMRQRADLANLDDELAALVRARRLISIRIAGEERFAAAEDAARFRDALGVPMPQGLPAAFLAPVGDALGDLLMRFARTHAPFTVDAPAARFGLAPAQVEAELIRLVDEGRLVSGEFRPGGATASGATRACSRCSARDRSRACARRSSPSMPRRSRACRSSGRASGLKRSGPDALLDVIEQLQGAPLVASALEANILPARLRDYDPAWLDALMAAGEVVWRGLESIGQRDGRVTLALADHAALISPPSAPPALSAAEKTLIAWLEKNGASFFADVHAVDGGGYPGDTVDRLWDLVWKGVVSNDSMHALRAYGRSAIETPRRFARARRAALPFAALGAAQGRRPMGAHGRVRRKFSIVSRENGPDGVGRRTRPSVPRALRHRHARSREGRRCSGRIRHALSGLQSHEEAGKVRRGYFIAGLGATQFAGAGRR
jgi:ATP-dependent Lhr-like helicase